MTDTPKFDGHGWRYGSRPYPAPDGIRFRATLVGGETMARAHEGRVFYQFTEGFLYVVDPANGGYPVGQIERGLIRRLEIAVA